MCTSPPAISLQTHNAVRDLTDVIAIATTRVSVNTMCCISKNLWSCLYGPGMTMWLSDTLML
jgi:hypothetical protein